MCGHFFYKDLKYFYSAQKKKSTLTVSMEIHKGASLYEYIHEFHPIFVLLLSAVTKIIPSVLTERSILQKEKLKLMHFCGSYRE
jgi:hypothetical protein